MLAGRYELHEIVGVGAFATVYRATDPRLDASVAVKVLADNWSRDVDIRRRFRAEAVLLRRVQSESAEPGIVNVFDIDETADGQPFIVMSFADRGTLRDRSAGSAWTAIDVLPVVESLAVSIGSLHRSGVVHRDLKPSNLLLRSDSGSQTSSGRLVGAGERLLIGDLGMAKDATLETSQMSFAGGSARYMAPEQQDVSRVIDFRADIHAASAIIAELLAGSDAMPAAGELLQGSLPDSLPKAVAKVLDRGVATNPQDRHESMDAWQTELTNAFRATVPKVESTPSARRSRKLAMFCAAAGLVAALAVAVALFLRGGQLEIVGAEQVVVGERATYQLSDGGEALWTDWTGATISAVDFDVLGVLPGSLTFSAEDEDGRVQRSVTVVASQAGPKINGPEALELGEQTVFTATLPSGAVSSYWIAPDGSQVDSADFRFVANEPGEFTISLVAVDRDAVERGERITVHVDS